MKLQSLVLTIAAVLVGVAVSACDGQRPLGLGPPDARVAREETDAAAPADTAIRRDAEARDMSIGSCGDGLVEPNLGEVCDDGNHVAGDGCSADCRLEILPACVPPAAPCPVASVCGDGKLTAREGCDDGNTANDDGCDSRCAAVAPGYRCPLSGRRCTPICGDGLLVAGEECEDGNTLAGDGCSPTCLREDGPSRCGDGVVSGGEACDDGGANGADPTAPAGCTTTCTFNHFCGDGDVDVSEACDLGDEQNHGGYGNAGGCTPACRLSPYCGDGIVDTAYHEVCDDGASNGVHDDLCTSTCQLII